MKFNNRKTRSRVAAMVSCRKEDSQPFRSRANSLPGANRPWNLRSQERNGHGTFVPLVHDVDTRYSNYTIVKRFALCYRHMSVCTVCRVCDVGVLWPNAWTDQDETCHAGIGLGPGHIVLDRDPAPPKGHSPKYFRPISVPDKWLHGSTCHLVWR